MAKTKAAKKARRPAAKAVRMEKMMAARQAAMTPGEGHRRLEPPVGTWMDTFGTGLMTRVGTGRPTAAKMAFVAYAFEPSGKKVVFDAVLRVRDRDHHTYEMWTKAPGGERYRNMLVEYVRV